MAKIEVVCFVLNVGIKLKVNVKKIWTILECKYVCIVHVYIYMYMYACICMCVYA